MLISSGSPIESGLIENIVANISQTYDGSVTIHSSSFNIMFQCDFNLLVINGPTASRKSLFDAPGFYLDKQ